MVDRLKLRFTSKDIKDGTGVHKTRAIEKGKGRR